MATDHRDLRPISNRPRRFAWRLIDGLVVTATAGVVLAAVGGANPDLFEYARLEAWDGDGNQFGYSVAIDEGTLATGAFSDDANGNNSGAVYLFQRAASGSWEDLVKLTASDGQPSDAFGWAVALSGSTLAVGSPGAGGSVPYAGAIYVFEANGEGRWTEVAKLTASEPSENDSLGSELAVDGDTILAGVPWEDSKFPSTGAAYVFERGPDRSWTTSARLDVGGLGTSAFFGESVSLDGDTAVIGAHQDTVGGVQSGAVYVFERSETRHEWTQRARLSPPDPEPYEWFGFSVAVSDGWIAVGAGLDTDDGLESGSVYLYQRTGDAWELVTKLRDPESDAYYGFGWAIALEGDQLVVGSPFESSDDGEALLFERVETPRGIEWLPSRKLLASNGGPYAYLGQQLAIDGTTIAVSPNPMYGGPEAVYVFSQDVFADGFESGDTAAWAVTVP